MISAVCGAKRLTAACLLGFLVPLSASAQVVFTWSEDASGVTMTTSGSIDTSQLTAVACETWGGYGHQASVTDIIGDTEISQPDTCFEFSTGTDFSPWQTGNPFETSFFSYSSTSVSTPFHTYTRDDDSNVIPGLGVLASDLSGDIWTPQGSWVADGETLASMGLNTGTFTVTDASTGASVTFTIGSAPGAPGTEAIPAVPLWGLVLGMLSLAFIGLGRLRRD